MRPGVDHAEFSRSRCCAPWALQSRALLFQYETQVPMRADRAIRSRAIGREAERLYLVTENQFAVLGLSEPLLRALDQAQYTTPTPIQSQSIPALLAGRDMIGLAQTGTGKTAAFALPMLQRLDTNRVP